MLKFVNSFNIGYGNFKNISFTCRSVLLLEGTRVPQVIYRTVTSHLHISSHNVV